MEDGTVFTLSSSATITKDPGSPNPANTSLLEKEWEKVLGSAAVFVRQQALAEALGKPGTPVIYLY